MAKLKTSWMSDAINQLDTFGWGSAGAASGAAVGGIYGAFSDDTSILGGMAKGAIGGYGMGRLARFGSGFGNMRNAAQMKIWGDQGFMNTTFKDFKGKSFAEAADMTATAVGDAGAAVANGYKQVSTKINAVNGVATP